ncbi:MAG TPA: phosphoribosylamine--glycine ligase [Planctomycetota bacterium]|nr:phosphoribosylamine--glycine ligase [Planctomycetota bacterium]
MKVLIIGSGGREHALAWKIAQSPKVEKLYCAPGNAGIAGVAECVDLPATEVQALLKFARREQIGLTVVGPEAPLVAGIADRFEASGLPIFGPSQRAAELEGSKVFAKHILRKHAIPTAHYDVFETVDAAEEHVRNAPLPLVIKADGLAAGKGVMVCQTREAALDAIAQIMKERLFGNAGNRIVVEACLFGEEASILALTDGRTIVPLPSSQDHKRICDNDEGPNTGGMGAYSPAPVITDDQAARIEREILIPIVHAMNAEDRRYKGVVYAGVMMTDDGPKVLEFNVRFGDPETQPILARLQGDLVPVLAAIAEGNLQKAELVWDPRPAVCVVMASGGYPGRYEKGKVIQGLDAAAALDDVTVFHAGTALKDGKVVTAGGRVLGVTALGDDIRGAIARAYEAVKLIRFDGAHYRTDIGARALHHTA